MHYTRVLAGLTFLALTAACGTKQQQPPYAGIKVGKPYEIYGRWYEPSYDAHYDEIGMASWYGPGFHGGKTANGDRYDQYEMTAAHRTLPLPSIVRVTNLDTGQSALVKVNDRGPFSHDRIIDLSKAAAIKLGVWRSGTAKVRVQFLDAETREYVKNMENGNSMEYAMDQVSRVNPEEATARQEASEKPQLALGSRIFGEDQSPDLVASDATVTPAIVTSQSPATFTPPATLTTVPTDPAPPKVHVLREPATKPQPFVAPHYDANEFAVVDAMPRLTPAGNPAAQAEAHFDGVAGKGFYIQAGTFSSEANARHLSGKLSSLGHADVRPVLVGERKFYRVAMGPYDTQPDAKNMLSKVAALGISDARITRN